MSHLWNSSHSMGELLAAAMEHRDPQGLGYICLHLGDMAKRLSEVLDANTYIDSTWRSLAHDVIRVLVEGEDLDKGVLSLKREIINKVARRLPPKYQDELGEIAWRGFLEFGTSKLKEVRDELELELGPLQGWYA